MFRKACTTPKIVFEKKLLYFPLGLPPFRRAFVYPWVFVTHLWGGEVETKLLESRVTAHPDPPASLKVPSRVERVPVLLWLSTLVFLKCWRECLAWSSGQAREGGPGAVGTGGTQQGGPGVGCSSEALCWGQWPSWPGRHSPRYFGQERNCSVYFLQKKKFRRFFLNKLFRLEGI